MPFFCDVITYKDAVKWMRANPDFNAQAQFPTKARKPRPSHKRKGLPLSTADKSDELPPTNAQHSPLHPAPRPSLSEQASK